MIVAEAWPETTELNIDRQSKSVKHFLNKAEFLGRQKYFRSVILYLLQYYVLVTSHVLNGFLSPMPEKLPTPGNRKQSQQYEDIGGRRGQGQAAK